jgi:glycosyltransferase involved in cell wall biosynthesis
MKIICVIPAFNEAKNILTVINLVKPLVSEVIVVDDCSQDETALLATSAGATVLRHVINRGQGAALRTGTQAALDHGAEIIVHFDADNQFRAEEIPDLVAPIMGGQADAVLGSRFLTKKSNLPPVKKIIIHPLARLVNRLFFNIRLTDPQSGFRALSRLVAKKIKIENDGMAHCSEILYQLFKNKFRVVEVPITVTYHRYGQKFSGGLKIIKDLLIQKLIH